MLHKRRLRAAGYEKNLALTRLTKYPNTMPPKTHRNCQSLTPSSFPFFLNRTRSLGSSPCVASLLHDSARLRWGDLDVAPSSSCSVSTTVTASPETTVAFSRCAEVERRSGVCSEMRAEPVRLISRVTEVMPGDIDTMLALLLQGVSSSAQRVGMCSAINTIQNLAR